MPWERAEWNLFADMGGEAELAGFDFKVMAGDFTNSFNSEMYTGGIEVGMPPNEAGMSRSDTDYLHVYNWQKLAELAKDPKNVKIVNDHKIIPMEVAKSGRYRPVLPPNQSPRRKNPKPQRWIRLLYRWIKQFGIIDI